MEVGVYLIFCRFKNVDDGFVRFLLGCMTLHREVLERILGEIGIYKRTME